MSQAPDPSKAIQLETLSSDEKKKHDDIKSRHSGLASRAAGEAKTWCDLNDAVGQQLIR